jgi:hypothetical protein
MATVQEQFGMRAAARRLVPFLGPTYSSTRDRLSISIATLIVNKAIGLSATASVRAETHGATTGGATGVKLHLEA